MNPTTAIAWELWSRNRWATTTVAVALPFLALINSSWIGEWFRAVEILFFFFSITTLFWTFCCIEPDARGRNGGFPPRMFTLPIQTLALLSVPMLGGALVLGLVYWLWTQLIFTAWEVTVPASWLRIHLLMFAAMLLSLQAIVWSLYRFPWIRLVLISLTLAGIGMLGLAAPGKDFRNMSESSVVGLLGLVNVIAFVAAVAGVSRDRRGEWQDWTQRFIDRLALLLPRRRKPFSSGADAQVWFEWRGKALFLSAVLALPVAISVMACPLPTVLHFDGPMRATACANVPLLALIMAWCLGMTLAKTDYWNREPQLSSFITARPLTDGDIALAKLKAAALIIALASLLFIALAIPCFNVGHWLSDPDMNWPSWSQFKSQNPQLLLHVSHPLVLLTAFVVTWSSIASGLALGLRGQKLVVIQVVVRVSLFITALILLSLLAKRPGGLQLIVSSLPWASALLIAWKITTTLVAFKRAKPLYSPRQRLALATLWLVVVACIIGTASRVWTNIPVFDHAIVFIAAFLAPSAALFRAALNLHQNRHQ